MILSVELKDFMGCNRIVETKTSTTLSGRNGSGKTTILHALAFALCGTDAWGTPAPTFMISNEKDKMEVIVKTDKTTIQRSLTRNKTANLKIMLEGVWVTMNQTQMATLIGPPAHVLSVLNPKYFFSLNQPKQVQLLASIIPEEDRVELVQTISGEDISMPDEIRIIRSKHPLRAAELFALKRREAENSKRYRDNWLLSLDERKKEVEEAMKEGYASPDEEQEYETLKKRDDLYRHECDTYRLRKEAANEARDKIDDQLKEFTAKALSASEDEKCLESRVQRANQLFQDAVRWAKASEDLAEELRVKSQQFSRTHPENPPLADLPQGDRCPRCAQPVSKRYREQIEEENRKLVEKFKKETQKFEFEAEELEREYEDARKASSKAKEHLSKASAALSEVQHLKVKAVHAMKFYEKELERLKKEVVRDPVLPERAYSADRLKELEERLAGLKPSRDLTALCDKLNGYELDKSKVIQDHRGVDEAAVHFFKLEQACKRIPEREMERAKTLFNFPGYVIDAEVKDLIMNTGGTPYSTMSAGQKMCAEISLSLHINSLLEKKVSIIFADDFELVDADSARNIKEKLQHYDVQVIRSKVTNEDFSSEAT